MTSIEVLALAGQKYPALMTYIQDRSALPKNDAWKQLRADEADAVQGGLAEVAKDLERAQADYKAEQEAAGRDGFPYNQEMGTFLGLPIRENGDPPHGYYFASKVKNHFRFGNATREVNALLEAGSTLKVVAARDSKTRQPVRFTTFKAHQINLEGGTIVCRNDKRIIRLSSNWSIETALETAVAALKTGNYYGQSAE